MARELSAGSIAPPQCSGRDPAVDLVSSGPFTGSWSSVGRSDSHDGGRNSEGTPDDVLVFTAPQSGIVRITSTGLVSTSWLP